jgi:hypothetical protein
MNFPSRVYPLLTRPVDLGIPSQHPVWGNDPSLTELAGITLHGLKEVALCEGT